MLLFGTDIPQRMEERDSAGARSYLLRWKLAVEVGNEHGSDEVLAKERMSQRLELSSEPSSRYNLVA